MNMRDVFRGTLWKKMMILFFIISVLPIGTVSYLNYRTAKADLKQRIYNELTAVATAKKQQITQFIKLRQEQVSIIAHSYAYRTFLEQGNPKNFDPVRLKTEMCNALKHQTNDLEAFTEIFITDVKGEIVISSHENDMGRNVSNSDVFVNGGKALYLKDFYFDPEVKEKTPLYAIAAPIVGATTDKLLGVLVVRIKASVFTEILKDYAGLGETGETLLVKKFGDEVVFLNNLRHDPDAALKRKVSVNSQDSVPCILSANGREGIIEAKDYRGGDVLAAYCHIPIGNWGLVSKIDTYEAFSPLYTLKNRKFYLSLYSILGIALIAYLFGTRITRPLAKLALASEKISEGDLSVKVEVVNTRDEIGILTRSFDLMTVKLRESYANLEQKIADRTSELETANNRLKRRQEFGLAYNEIITTINAEMGTEKLLSKSLCNIASFTHSQVGILYLYDEKEGNLKMGAGYAVGDDNVKLENFGVGIGIPGQAAQEKRCIIVKDIPGDTLFKIKYGPGDCIPRSIVSFPILLQDKLLGVLVLASLKDYSDDMLEFVETINRQLAVAISNLQAYQLVQWQAEELQQKGEELTLQNEELRSQTDELRAQQRELEEKNLEIKRANQAKSEFLANMSHELRTPLNSIIGFSEVLGDLSFGDLNEKQKKYVHNIHTSGKQLLQLINDILDLSKVEAGKMGLRYEEFSISEILSGVKTMVKTEVDKKNLSFDMEIDKHLTTINADKQKFGQIMINLLSNAVKFTPKDGKIKVSAKWINGSVQISVADTGIGIKPEDQERIFSKFQQIDNKTAREYAGTGLGLALTKKFVGMHGGKIWLESEFGKGSTFTFTIPLKPESGTFYKEATSSEAVEKSGKFPLILVVEDDPQSSELLKTYLTQEGYTVATAFNGKDAVAKAKELKPMAITLDIILPGKNGWKVLAELKEMSETKDIPVIIVSITEERELGFSLGAIDYLIKPINREELIRTLKRHGLTVRPEGSPVHILVIDDEPKTVELVSAVLESEGYCVRKAYGGQEGIDLATSQEHDLIILDLMMPKVDGFDVVEELKRHARSKDVPIIISTAKDLTEEDFLRLRGKVESIAQKGKFSKEALLEVIKRIEKARMEKRETRVRWFG